MSSLVRPAVAYLRVSTERQASEDRTSLADQRAAIERLATELGASVERWHTDAGFSGATAGKRPAFLAMVADCRARPRPRRAPGVVLVLNASRFGRFDPDEAAHWRHELRQVGWEVRYVEGDAEGDVAPVVRAVMSLEAQAYRKTLIANTRRGMKGAATLGYWTREAPYGYRRQVVGSGRILERGELKTEAEKVRLTPHEAEAALVRWVFERYASGEHSLGSLATELARVVPGRRWSRTVVNAMLRNEAYRGAVVGGRRRDGSPERYGREAAHPAIVEPRLWVAVQDRLRRNARLGPGTRSSYLLSGLLRCALCGEAYHGGGGGRSRTRSPERSHRRFYRDAGGIAEVCPGRIGTVMRHLVDDAAIALVTGALRAPAVRRQIERAVDDALGDAPGRVGERESAARAARAAAERRIDRLAAALGDGTLLPKEAAPQLEEARAALAAAEDMLQALRFAQGRARGLSAERDQLMVAVADFPALVAQADGLRMRRLLEPWLGMARFDKVTRELTLGIRPLPAMGLLTSGGPAGRNEGRLIVRRTSLVQPGHERRVAAAVRGGRSA